MPHRLAAEGHTTVILILNMRRFIQGEAERQRFEAVRGTEAMAQRLNQWPTLLQQHADAHPAFSPRYPASVNHHTMSPEEIGFATGVFRRRLLEIFSQPTYRLNKEHIAFDQALASNLQFKTLFLKAWQRWEIELRPTHTGFFVIRLRQTYQGRSLLQIARDVLRLQEPFDIRSAVDWLRRKERELADQPAALAKTRRSIHTLLRWLGADPERPHEAWVLYYPLQWKLAIEVINWFLESAPFTLPGPEGGPPIHLTPAPPSLSLPLHDSYILHYFHRLLAEPTLLERSSSASSTGVKIPVSANDLYQAKRLRNALASFLEGTVLSQKEKGAKSSQASPAGEYLFPQVRWRYADALLEQNLASWNDEFCILTSRTGLVLPASRWEKYRLNVSTMPGATLQVHYADYWRAIERLVEFGLETQVLAQLIEGESFDLLERMAETVERMREGMFRGNVEFDQKIKGLVTRAAHLRRIAALAQNMHHARVWTRAEYAVLKMEALYRALGLYETLAHIQRNIEGINQVADHVDELYLADLAEKNNTRSSRLSLLLSAISTSLVVLMLPSFLADLINTVQLNQSFGNPLFVVLGFAGLLIVVGLLWASLPAIWPPLQRLRQMRHLLKDMLQEEAPPGETPLGSPPHSAGDERVQPAVGQTTRQPSH